MAAPIGAVVRISYDSETPVRAGDWMRTQAGRCYHVLSVRVQTRGKHAGRQFVTAVVVDEVPEAAQAHPIYWHKRSGIRDPGQRDPAFACGKGLDLQ